MSPAAHDRSALAKFQDGEERLVYARLRADPDKPLYFLEDGKAREIRAWAKEHLECFMPECTARQLTTVSRATRRDGFSHRRGAGGHARESLFHQQAKALIARWVTHRFGGEVTARLEQATESRERRADVMLTWRSGARLAVEIQYAAMTPAQWRARHDSYKAQGLSCLWLLGHLPPHLREARGVTATSVGSGGAVALGALHQAMIDANVPLLWINPIDESIGTVWTHAEAHECEDYPCPCRGDNRTFRVPARLTGTGTWDFGFFGVDALSDCDITPEGFTPLQLRDLPPRSLRTSRRVKPMSRPRRLFERNDCVEKPRATASRPFCSESRQSARVGSTRKTNGYGVGYSSTVLPSYRSGKHRHYTPP